MLSEQGKLEVGGVKGRMCAARCAGRLVLWLEATLLSSLLVFLQRATPYVFKGCQTRKSLFVRRHGALDDVVARYCGYPNLTWIAGTQVRNTFEHK